MLLKVKTYRLRRSGDRGVIVQIPTAYCEEVGLGPTDSVDLYRDSKDPSALVLKPHTD